MHLPTVADIARRIYFVAIDDNFKMAVVSVSITGLAHGSDLLALADLLARRDIDGTVVSIQRLHAVPMVNDHIVAVAVVPPVVGRRYNRT